MARETTSEPKDTTRPVEPRTGNPESFSPPDFISPYKSFDDPPPESWYRRNVVPLNPLGDPAHRMSPPETSVDLEKQSNLRLSHPDEKWGWPGTAEDAILFVYGKPTKDNTKWFDNVWWKGANELVMRAITDFKHDDLMTIANKMGWPAFDAVTKLHVMNNPTAEERKIKGFNVQDEKKIPGFNAPGGPDGVLKRQLPSKIKGFNTPRDDENKPWREEGEDEIKGGKLPIPFGGGTGKQPGFDKDAPGE